MRILEHNPTVEARYEALLDASPGASVYQTMDWLRIFERLGCELMFVEADAETLIPFVCKGKGTLRRAFSLPYDTYGGPVNPDGRRVSYEEVLRTLDIPSTRLVDFSSAVQPSGCHVETVRTHLVELDKGYDKVFENYRKMQQRALRQADNRGVRVTVVEDRRHVRLFWRLYRRTILKYRTPPLPLVFFQSIFDLMVPKGRARFYLAWTDQKAIAGNLVLRYKQTAYDWTWGYDRRFLHLRPTNSMIDRAIQDEIAEGTRVFNLGTSPPKSNGNVAFKENFGAIEYPYHILSRSGFCYATARALKKGLRFHGRFR